MATVTIDQAVSIALDHQRAGRLAEAQTIYQAILARDPNHAHALHLLGLIAYQGGDHETAAQLIQRAIAVNPGVPEFYSNLGEVYRALRQTTEAVAAQRRAIALKPDFAQAHYNLGVALQDKGRLEEAIASYQSAVAINPAFAAAYANLGAALQGRGRPEEAITANRQAIAVKPDFAEAYTNLGNVLRDQGRLGEAAAAHRQAVSLNADLAPAYSNLGNVLADQGQFDQAVAAHRQAIALGPLVAESFYKLGVALQRGGRSEEAVEAYRRAIELRPDYPQAYCNIGKARTEQGDTDQGVAAYRRAIALKPDYAEAYSNLGTTLQQCGRLDEAMESYRTSLSIQDNPAVHSNLLYALPFHPAYDAQAILAEGREWNLRHAAALTAAAAGHDNDRSPDRRLRIGYVSADFRDHIVARCIEPALVHHDRAAFDVVCYSSVRHEDAVTARLRGYGHTWRSIANLNDAQAAALIRADRMDILVDYTQHMADNRLLVLARRPAPVQISMAYPATTGVAAIDYRLGDPYLDPPGSEGDNSEKLARLPRCFWCLLAPGGESAGPLPALANGLVTFGSLNNVAKVNGQGIELWSQVLRRVPGSRLMLLIPGRGSIEESLRRQFESHGIEASRLELAVRRPLPQYLQLYNRVDIGLDPIPCNGHTTSCDSFWMGVPVVTLRGRTSIGRGGVSLLSNLGLPELIGETPQEYVDIAARLAADLPRLGQLRQGLRQRMERSPIMDATGYTRDLEGLYRQMWRTWCATIL